MQILASIRRWWQARSLRRARIPIRLWLRCVRETPILSELSEDEATRLRVLASIFLQEKDIRGARGFAPDARVRCLLSAQACLLILELEGGLEWYRELQTIWIHPDTYQVPVDHGDGRQQGHSVRAGEAWQKGPVVLAWSDAEASQQKKGSNLILHEFAHVIDQLDGSSNGAPPFTAKIRPREWQERFSQAFEDLQERVVHRRRTRIDPYGAENPAEFFAVLTEIFFCDPKTLVKVYPEIYEELRLFYGQNTLERMSRHAARPGV